MKANAIGIILFVILFALPVCAQKKSDAIVNGHEVWTVDGWVTQSVRTYFDETGLSRKYSSREVDEVLLFYSPDQTVAECAVKVNKYYLLRNIVNAKNELSLYDIHEILNYGNISYKSEGTEEFIKSVMPHYSQNEVYHLSDQQKEVEKITGIKILNIYIDPEAKGFSSEQFNFYDASMPIAEAYYTNRDHNQSADAAFNLVSRKYGIELNQLEDFARTIFKTGKPNETTVQKVVKLWLELAYYENMRRTILKNCKTLYNANEKTLQPCISVFRHELEVAAGREKNDQSVVGTLGRAKPGKKEAKKGDWVLVSATVSPEDPNVTWKDHTWSYTAQSTSAHYSIYNGDFKIDYSWEPPPSSFGLNGFQVSFGFSGTAVRNQTISAVIGVSTSGLSSDTPDDQEHRTASGAGNGSINAKKSVNFKPMPSASDIVLKIGMGWSVSYTYKYHRL